MMELMMQMKILLIRSIFTNQIMFCLILDLLMLSWTKLIVGLKLVIKLVGIRLCLTANRAMILLDFLIRI